MMTSLALALMLLVAQSPTPAPAPTTVPPAAAAPAKPPAAAPPAAPTAGATPPASVNKPSASPRLEGLLAGWKGQPRTTATAKFGPPESVRTAIDGEVLFWTVSLSGQTVCGADASGQLACVRQGGGSCALALAFKTQGGLSAWKFDGLPAACESAADLFSRPTVTAPDTSKPKPSPVMIPMDE